MSLFFFQKKLKTFKGFSLRCSAFAIALICKAGRQASTDCLRRWLLCRVGRTTNLQVWPVVAGGRFNP